MADVTFTNSCINVDPASRQCHLSGQTCPFSPSQESQCTDCRFLAKITCPPDEFHVLIDAWQRPRPGKFAIKRCRTIEVHEAAGVHVTNLLTCESERSLLHATPLSSDTVQLSTPEDATLRWHAGRFIPV
jgi:hypothetical protein